MDNKIIIHAAGGAGINIIGSLNRALSGLDSGFNNFEFKHLDTSYENIKVFEEHNLDFYKINSKTIDEDTDGSGGERAENNDAILTGVKDYINKNKYFEPKLGEIHIVVFGMAGGSGSMIGPYIIRELMSKDVPVVGICVGDDGDLLRTNHTLYTIKTLDAFAAKCKKPLNLMYFNNTKVDGESAIDKRQNVDKTIFRSIAILAAFTSKSVVALDNKDMLNFFCQEKYTTFEVKPGLYTIEMFDSKNKSIRENRKYMVSRSLITNDTMDGSFPITVSHDKNGIVGDKGIFKIIDESLFPIYIATSTGGFKEEVVSLHDKLTKLKDINDKVSSENLSLDGDDNRSTDDGVFF